MKLLKSTSNSSRWGSSPLYRDEGYLFVYDEDRNEVNNYRYAKSRVLLDGERHVQLALRPVEQLKKRGPSRLSK